MDSKDSAMDTDALLHKDETPARKYQKLFNDSDSDDSFPDIECDLCSKSFSNVKAYEQHLNGKKHHQMLSKKKLMKKIRPTNDEEDENIDPDDSTEELQCDVCEKSFSGYKPYVSHMKGNIHAKNVKQQKLKESLKDKPEVIAENSDELEFEDDCLLQKPFARCSACEKVFYDPTSYQKHMIGSMHKKKMIQQRTLDSLKNELKDDPQIEDDEFFTKCDVCSKQFSGPVPFKIHLKSGVHENQVKRVQAKEKLKDFFLEDSTTGAMICKECKRMFPDPFAFKLHLENNSHEKQKVKDNVLEFVAANPEIVAMKSVENLSSEDESEEKAVYEKGYYYLVCKLCHMSFTGLESAGAHVQSKKHVNAKDEKKKLKLLKSRMAEKKGDQASVNSLNGQAKKVSGAPSSTAVVSKMDAKHADNDEDFELV